MPNPKVREDIKIGQLVKIVRIRKDKEHYIIGTVSEILDELPYNEDGIEVVLKEGFSGNVIGFPKEDWLTLEELKHRIKNHEDPTFELKSSFDYATQENQGKKPNLPLELTKEVVAFLNSKTGGYICLGVSNKPEILGLEGDYQILKKSDSKLKRMKDEDITKELLRDRFELRLRQKISSHVYRKPRILPLDIQFYDLEGKDVCLLKMLPQKIPYFVAITNAYKDVEFRVRDGTSKQDLNIPDAIYYWIDNKLD